MENEAEVLKRHTIEVVKFLTTTVNYTELLRFMPKFEEEDYDFLDEIEDPDEKQLSLLAMTREAAHSIHIYVGCPTEPDVDQINIALFGIMIYGDEIQSMLFFEEE